MLDINHIIANESQVFPDAEGNMYDLDHWSPFTAMQMAKEEGIDELTEAHWHVIYALRNLYREQGRADNPRTVMHMLAQDFLNEGGQRYLYELFPKGPLNQASRLAGVPAPMHSSDPSFGWAG